MQEGEDYFFSCASRVLSTEESWGLQDLPLYVNLQAIPSRGRREEALVRFYCRLLHG